MQYLTNEWIKFFGFAIPSGILIIIMKYFFAMLSGMRSQLKSSIMRYYYDYVERGFIYTDAMECVEDMYRSYKMLGGNGFVTKKVEFLRALPNIPQKKKKGDL